MEDLENNENNSEKDVHCEEESTDISTGQECSFSFSKLRSKARCESCVGEHLRSSLQTCEVKNNLDKLKGLLKCTNKSLVKILNGLIYILNQLLAQSKHSSKAIGFISFEDAYGLYCGFFDSSPEEALFRDHLLHKDHGLCVIITEVYGKRYILLKNQEVSILDFFIELEKLSEENAMTDLSNQRFPLDSQSVRKILDTMDTEYDRMALKAVIFALHSRSQTYELGIKPDRAVMFLSKVLTVAEESENALKAAEDILKLRTRERVENIEEKIRNLDTRIEKSLLSEKRRCELEGGKDALKERLDNLKELEKNESPSSQRITQQRKRKIAQDLIATNRLKKRKLGAGAPQLLDSEDETFIAKAISTKSTCHGRRHETTLFTNHRVKKRDFLSLAIYSLMKRGKKLIKSATTVANRGKPKNVRSIAAKSHVGKWLWCAKKPPKTEDHDTVSTHHQRAHVLNAKLTMFSEVQKEHSLVVSMDDKAYLRPGTDVGARNTKAGVIYDVCDPNEQKKLPQHDFNNSQVNQTPASFRLIKQHIENIQEKDELIGDQDQSLVIIRPKYYIGSCGSMWASDYMRLCYEVPQLFQENPQNTSLSIELQRLAIRSHDVVYYFTDLTMEEDVMRVTIDTGCKYYCYEQEKLIWFQTQISDITIQCKEAVHLESEQEIESELLEKLSSLQEKAASLQTLMLTHVRRGKLWDVTNDIFIECQQYLNDLDNLRCPKICCDILKTTDAGPGVGVSNIEVRFREVEIARIQSSERVNRIHRAPGDSAQNEAERTNAAIGDALVDGTALKWEYFKPFDGLTDEEIKKLTATEVKEREAICMEKNAWEVAKKVTAMVDDEPGPAKDYLKCYTTTTSNCQFFFNKSYLMKYANAKTDAAKHPVAGYHYFDKIYSFMDSHCIIGEMFLEYLKGACKENGESGTLCDFCSTRERCCEEIQRVARPFPDIPDNESNGYHYLPLSKTPTNNRVFDDYMPRAQLKAAYASGQCSLDDPSSISNFSRKFVVAEGCVKQYLEHLTLLDLKKDKRKRERLAKKSAETSKKYQDYDWNGMFKDGSLSKQTNAVLDKYLKHHGLRTASNKHGKLMEVQRHIVEQQVNKSTPREDPLYSSEDEEEIYSSLDEENNDTDYVLGEIGSSSDDNDKEDNIQITVTTTRSGRRATRYLL